MTIGEGEDVERSVEKKGRGKGSYVELPGLTQASLQFGQERVHTPTKEVLALQLLLYNANYIWGRINPQGQKRLLYGMTGNER